MSDDYDGWRTKTGDNEKHLSKNSLANEVTKSEKSAYRIKETFYREWYVANGISMFSATVILTRMPSGQQRHEGVDSDPTSAPLSLQSPPRIPADFESIRTAIECKCGVLWIAFILTPCSISRNFMEEQDERNGCFSNVWEREMFQKRVCLAVWERNWTLRLLRTVTLVEEECFNNYFYVFISTFIDNQISLIYFLLKISELNQTFHSRIIFVVIIYSSLCIKLLISSMFLNYFYSYSQITMSFLTFLSLFSFFFF